MFRTAQSLDSSSLRRHTVRSGVCGCVSTTHTASSQNGLLTCCSFSGRCSYRKNAIMRSSFTTDASAISSATFLLICSTLSMSASSLFRFLSLVLVAHEHLRVVWRVALLGVYRNTIHLEHLDRVAVRRVMARLVVTLEARRVTAAACHEQRQRYY